MQARIDYAEKCGTSKAPCSPQPKREKGEREKETNRGKLHYLMGVDYWIGHKLPWKAGRAGYVQSIKRNNFTKFTYKITYSSCDAVCTVTMNSEEDSGEDGCWVGCWQYLPWLTLVGESSGMKTVLSGLFCWPSGSDSELPMQGTQTLSLVRSLDPTCGS